MADDRPPVRHKGGSSMAALLLLLILGIAESTSPSEVFLEMPEAQYYVWEGKEGPALKCTVAPEFRGDNFEVQWTRYTKSTPRTLSRNAKLLDRSGHFELRHDPTTGQHDLVIKTVDRTDTSGAFHCSVLNTEDGMQHSAHAAEVVVLVPPGEPEITAEPKKAITEGEVITLKCTTSGGSPTPSFQWYFHNDSLAPSDSYSQQIHGDTVESTIHWQASSSDNGAFVTCAVSNLAMDEGVERKVKSTRLNVLYKPNVKVGPVSEYAVEVGKPITLTCGADANPSQPSYEWEHLATGQRFAASNWPFVAEKDMSGKFVCRVRNTVGEGAATVNVLVQYAPQVHVKDVVNPSEGEGVHVECEVDSVPAVDSVDWTGPNGFVSRGSTLSIPSITREQSGNYTCAATNILNVYGEEGSQPRVGRGTTLVDVKRRPGRGVITPWTLSVSVGGTIELNCDASDTGSPVATYKWSSPASGGQYGTKEHTRQTLVIRNAQLADNGEYRCVPYNTIGEGEAGVARVVVIEPASISRPMAVERIYNAGDQEQELSCEARGYPAPEVAWTKDGQPLAGFDAWKVETTPTSPGCSPLDYHCFEAVSVTSTLRWNRPVIWSDKGNYSCVASNGAETASTWSLARVIHGPVVLNERYPTEALAAADERSTAIISCRVSARPEPSFEWLHDSKPIVDGGRYSMQTNRELEHPDEYERILYISEATTEDFGRYVCRAMNGKGEKAEVVIKLREKGMPLMADKLQKISGTANSLLVAWRPGFDGGYDQSFLIEYRRVNPFTESVADEEVFTVEVKNTTLRNVLVPESVKRARRAVESSPSSVANLITYNLTGLLPLSTYYIRVRSSNKIGGSEFTPISIATTDDVITRPEMVIPTSIDYVVADNVFSVQPPTPSNQCLLLYVSSGDVWRSVECYNANRTTAIPTGGDKFKARFCRTSLRGQIVECSAESRQLVASMLSPPYRLALLVPIAVLGFVLLVVCAALIICCSPCKGSPAKAAKGPLELARRSKNKKKLTGLPDERPTVSGPLPTGDSKNAPKNGSANDSGVFTLDSSNLVAKSPTKLYGSDRSANFSSHENGVDVWPAADDGYHGFAGEAYLTEAYPAGAGATATYYDGGYSPNHAGSAECGQTATTTYSDEVDGEDAYTGRTMREVIV